MYRQMPLVTTVDGLYHATCTDSRHWSQLLMVCIMLHVQTDASGHNCLWSVSCYMYRQTPLVTTVDGLYHATCTDRRHWSQLLMVCIMLHVQTDAIGHNC